MRLSVRYRCERVYCRGLSGRKGDKGVIRRAHSRKLTFLVWNCVVSLFIILRSVLFLFQHAKVFVWYLHGEGAPTLVEVFAGWSGRTLTTAEKHATIVERLNSQRVVLSWTTVTASNVDNKIDTVRRKGEKVHKTFRLKKCTGAPDADNFDLKVTKLFWHE